MKRLLSMDRRALGDGFHEKLLTVFCNRRLLVIFLLGFSSGLPLALTGTTLQAWFSDVGQSVMLVGFLGLLGQPYIYKFMWAPLMDRYVPLGLGRRKGWMLCCQVFLLISLLMMACLDPVGHTLALCITAFMVAFFSASQDIAVDAYRTDVLTGDERGLGVALYTLGYRLAMVISGGLALILAQVVGWRLTYMFMAWMVLIGMSATLLGPKPVQAPPPPCSLWQSVVLPFSDFIKRPKAIALLLFMITYKLGDAFIYNSSVPFLLNELHITLAEVGAVLKGVGLLAVLLGVFVGGVLLKYWKLYQSLLRFGIAQVLANLSYLLLAMVGKYTGLIVAAVFVEQFCAGLITAGLVSLLMGLCNPRYTATQFALFTAFAAIGRVYIGSFSGYMAESMGWTWFFGFTAMSCFPALMVLKYVKEEIMVIDQGLGKSSLPQ